MDELLVKYLLGETTEAEQRLVLEWLRADKRNEQYFEHFRIIWDESRKLAAGSAVDTDAAWEKFKNRRDAAVAPAPQVVPFPQRRNMPLRRIAAALAVLLVAGGFIAYYTGSFSSKEIVIASGNEVLTDTLPDGSVITLNKHSTLAYNRSFNSKIRAVTLTGEGFFHVTPNKQKPFEITANGVNIHVVGTSFNVKTTVAQTEVIVETGIVRVGIPKEKVELYPRQKAIVTEQNRKLAVEKQEGQLYNYYRTREFVCDNTPLSELAEALNSAFGNPVVVVDPSIKNMPINTTFRGNSLDEILKVVAATFNLKIEQGKGQVILK